MEQLTLDIFTTKEKSKGPCIWLEWWNGYRFCYLRQTFRLPCPGCEQTTPRYKEYIDG